jgi:hypothetical protein
MRKLHNCTVCDKDTPIVLFPDYSSSNLWCLNCGVECTNPNECLPDLPNGLVHLIDLWGLLWDMASEASKKQINKEYFGNLIIESGREINKQINEYYVCIFDEDRSKLDDPPCFRNGHWEQPEGNIID